MISSPFWSGWISQQYNGENWSFEMQFLPIKIGLRKKPMNCGYMKDFDVPREAPRRLWAFTEPDFLGVWRTRFRTGQKLWLRVCSVSIRVCWWCEKMEIILIWKSSIYGDFFLCCDFLRIEIGIFSSLVDYRCCIYGDKNWVWCEWNTLVNYN